MTTRRPLRPSYAAATRNRNRSLFLFVASCFRPCRVSIYGMGLGDMFDFSGVNHRDISEAESPICTVEIIFWRQHKKKWEYLYRLKVQKIIFPHWKRATQVWFRSTAYSQLPHAVLSYCSCSIEPKFNWNVHFQNNEWTNALVDSTLKN